MLNAAMMQSRKISSPCGEASAIDIHDIEGRINLDRNFHKRVKEGNKAL